MSKSTSDSLDPTDPGSPTDAVRTAVALFEQQEAQLASLRAALEHGEAAGLSPSTILEQWAAAKAEAPGTTEG